MARRLANAGNRWGRCCTKPGVLPKLGGMECKDDILFIHSGLHKLIGNQTIRIVALNPDFAPHNVNVNHHVVNTFPVVPPDIQDLVTVSLSVDEHSALNLSVRGPMRAILVNKPFDGLPIMGQLVH